VKSLCTRGILLEHGTVKMMGRVDEVVSYYFGGDNDIKNYKEFTAPYMSSNDFQIKSMGVRAKGKDFSEPILRNEDLEFVFHYNNKDTSAAHYDFTLKFKGEDGEYVMVTSTAHYQESIIKSGEHTIIMNIPGKFLNEVTFYVDFLLVVNNQEVPVMENDVISFSVNPEVRPMGAWMGREVGYFRPSFDWE